VTPRTRVRLCGPLRVEIDGREVAVTGQARCLLAFLLTHGPVDRGALIDLLWPDCPPRDPHAALRPLLSRLRRALAPGAIDGREQVRLVLPEPVWVDVEAAAQAAPLAALELIGPGFLPAVEADWARGRREEVEEMRLHALEQIGGEAAARELVARAPYRESGYRLLIEALAAAGNVAEALRVYDRLRRRLRDDLGITPAPEIVALHRRLIAGEQRPATIIVDQVARQPLAYAEAADYDFLRSTARCSWALFMLERPSMLRFLASS
jgi:pentatricopeptide repeat protein